VDFNGVDFTRLDLKVDALEDFRIGIVFQLAVEIFDLEHW